MDNKEAYPACFETLAHLTLLGLPRHAPSLAKGTGSTCLGGLNKEPEIKVWMEVGIPLNSSSHVGVPGFFKAQRSLEKPSFPYCPHTARFTPLSGYYHLNMIWLYKRLHRPWCFLEVVPS